jgi:hypothetical protein
VDDADESADHAQAHGDQPGENRRLRDRPEQDAAVKRSARAPPCRKVRPSDTEGATMRSTTCIEEVPPVTLDAHTSWWHERAGGQISVAVP